MKGPCAKQTTMAIIVNGDKTWVGYNWCEKPQAVCPREVLGYSTGEGYHLCKEVCEQHAHAEVDVCEKAGQGARDGVLYLFGHFYACKDCIQVMKECGIKRYEVMVNESSCSL